MRNTLITIATPALALLALLEAGLAFPMPWWLYLSVVIAFAAALIRLVPVRRQVGRLGVLAAIIAVAAILHFVDWTSRKPFLRDFARVQIGMTEAEVRHIMEQYMEGTGWAVPPPANPADSSGTLTDAGSGAQYATVAAPSGEMVIRDSLVFRHSNDRKFNSDWAIVSFSSGRVVRIEFSPD